MSKEDLTLKLYNKVSGNELSDYNLIPESVRLYLDVFTYKEVAIPTIAEKIRKEKNCSLQSLSNSFQLSHTFFRTIGARIGEYKRPYRPVKFKSKT